MNFKNMLKSDETLFKNPEALEYEFIPKQIPFREAEQRQISFAIKPLFQNMNGKNIIVTGKPGIGKTVATKHLLREIEDDTDSLNPISDLTYCVYINCWKKNSSYKILLEICDILGYKFTHNKKTDELFEVVKKIINKKTAIFVFDEIDKVEDTGFLYFILEEVYKKSIILITNYKEWINNLDQRIKSRLLPEIIEFNAYNLNETRKILEERIKIGFFDGVIPQEVTKLIAEKTFELKDIRTGLNLLREAGINAEQESRKKLTLDDAKKAMEKLEDFKPKKLDDLDEHENTVLRIIKENSGEKIGTLYDIYSKTGGKTYKTFQRTIKKLSDNKYISIKKIQGGIEGNTTIITYASLKKLNEF